jgi:hypothetical protein
VARERRDLVAEDRPRMGEAGDFRETGFIDTLDPRTRKRSPNPPVKSPETLKTLNI